MLKFKFFHIPKPRQFNYTPRTYNPELEKFEHLKEKHDVKTGRKPRIDFSKGREERRKAQKTTNMRLAVIIAVLVFIGWWLLS